MTSQLAGSGPTDSAEPGTLPMDATAGLDAYASRRP